MPPLPNNNKQTNKKIPVQITLLGYLIPPKGRISRKIKFSSTEVIESLIVRTDDAGNIDTIIKKKKEKSASRVLQSVQPYILVLGKLHDFSALYIVIDDVKYSFESAAKAFDVLFKIYHVLHAKYPDAANYLYLSFTLDRVVVVMLWSIDSCATAAVATRRQVARCLAEWEQSFILECVTDLMRSVHRVGERPRDLLPSTFPCTTSRSMESSLRYVVWLPCALILLARDSLFPMVCTWNPISSNASYPVLVDPAELLHSFLPVWGVLAADEDAFSFNQVNYSSTFG
ncbi:hypothetical protein MSG28_014830 [Choristoneura fumiferana]|uniref:Uncharacterized protein n=1 Tax=Choristoneura fumiferana TaxID=7141 RepID=A0ACC0JTB9_CHOFU|nr:hypothetical protein MSG28_014830 [Choristoneura fumiferana]